MRLRRIPAKPEHEAFYQGMVAALTVECKKSPQMTNLEIIAVMGRLIGYCVGMCFPNERAHARSTAVENIDAGSGDFEKSTITMTPPIYKRVLQ